MRHYILEGKDAVPFHGSLEAWCIAFEIMDRVVAKTAAANAEVSTVFLGLDHNWGSGPPLIFETMIFGGKFNEYQARYSTWAEAEEGHARVVEAIEAGKNPNDLDT